MGAQNRTLLSSSPLCKSPSVPPEKATISKPHSYRNDEKKGKNVLSWNSSLMAIVGLPRFGSAAIKSSTACLRSANGSGVKFGSFLIEMPLSHSDHAPPHVNWSFLPSRSTTILSIRHLLPEPPHPLLEAQMNVWREESFAARKSLRLQGDVL